MLPRSFLLYFPAKIKRAFAQAKSAVALHEIVAALPEGQEHKIRFCDIRGYVFQLRKELVLFDGEPSEGDFNAFRGFFFWEAYRGELQVF